MSDNKKKAELFNRYFDSVFTKREKVITTNENKSKLTCSEKQISDILCDLNTNPSKSKSTGSDRIGSLILKKCRNTLFKSMKLLFRTSQKNSGFLHIG